MPGSRRSSRRLGIIAGVLLVAVALYIGWNRADNVLQSNPFASFESRCDKLPTPAINVVRSTAVLAQSDALPFSKLTAMSGGSSPYHRTVGLTQARLSYTTNIQVRGIEERSSGKVCVRPTVHVDVSISPINVYVASEYRDDKCKHEAILEHEQKHVAVNNAYVAEVAPKLQAELSRAVGSKVLYAGSMASGEEEIKRTVSDVLAAFMDSSERELAERQNAIDTPEEYARVEAACRLSSAERTPSPGAADTPATDGGGDTAKATSER
jgi:hypothetical protein